MSYLDNYKSRINSYGSTEQTKLQEYGRLSFNELLTYSGNRFDVNINTDTDTKYAIVLDDNYKSEDLYDEKILYCAYNSNLKSGDYFPWRNFNWLLFEEEIKTIFSYKKFYVGKCNEYLSFYDNNGNLHSIPCLIRYISRSSVGAKEDKYMITLNRMLEIEIQNNEFTSAIRERDGYKFVFEENSFKLMNVNRYMKHGTILLSLEQEEINFEQDKEITYDDRTIWIGDYTSRAQFTLELTPMLTEISIGDTLQMEYILLDNKGLSSDKSVIWESNDETIATINEDGLVTAIENGSITITCNMENNVDVKDSILLDVTTTPSENIEYIITPNIDSLYRTESKTITVNKTNNGTVELEAFTFSIDVSTIVDEENYTFTIADDNNFELKCITEGGTINIRIVPNSDVGNSFVKSFDLIGYW